MNKRSAIATLTAGTKQMKKQPNILFLFPDQWRGDWVGCVSDIGLRTPHLDALAARGMTFTQAYTPSPLCSPARACLALGRDYEHCGVPANRHNTDTGLPTYYKGLRDAGYEVAGVGKFDLHKPDLYQGPDGQDKIHDYGFTDGCDNAGKWDAVIEFGMDPDNPRDPYFAYLKSRGLDRVHANAMRNGIEHPTGAWITPLPDDAYCDNWIAENALSFLRRFPEGRPWHLVINSTGPHEPFDVTWDMHQAWKDADLPLPVNNTIDRPEAVLARRRHYAAMIENIDRHLGLFLAEVERRGESDNTLVVFSSDHGEMLGDHGRWSKSVPYAGSAHIPLIVAGPGVRHGVQHDGPVMLQDLANTYLELAGAESLPGDGESMSLTRLLDGSVTDHREVATSGLPDWRMSFDGRYKLVTEKDKGDILWDLEDDPTETVNLAAERPHEVARLKTYLQ
jgi:arylsulfatase